MLDGQRAQRGAFTERLTFQACQHSARSSRDRWQTLRVMDGVGMGSLGTRSLFGFLCRAVWRRDKVGLRPRLEP